MPKTAGDIFEDAGIPRWLRVKDAPLFIDFCIHDAAIELKRSLRLKQSVGRIEQLIREQLESAWGPYQKLI